MNSFKNIKIFLICIISVLSGLCFNNKSSANTEVEKGLLFDGYMLGIALRQLDANDFLIADIPLIEARIPIKTNLVQLKYGGNLQWGLSQFFVEWNYAAGLIFYPFGEFLGIHATGRLGSFFFDNLSNTSAFGLFVDIPCGNKLIISLGAEYFNHNSIDLLDYVSFPGDETINNRVDGIGARIGIRL